MLDSINSRHQKIFSFRFEDTEATVHRGSRDGTVVRALASHRCGSGSILELNAICGLSLLLVLFSAPRGFSLGTPVFPSPQKPTFPNSNSIQISVDEQPLCGGATANSYSILFYSILYMSCKFCYSKNYKLQVKKYQKIKQLKQKIMILPAYRQHMGI